MFRKIEFYAGLIMLGIRLIRKEAKLYIDPITKEILILDPIGQETWVLAI